MRQLFSRSSTQHWPPAWTYQTDGILWLFRINAHGRIVGETRHPTRKEASYFCLDEKTGRVLWDGVLLDERWWIGLEDLDDSRVYLHRYRKPDMPQHLGIIAVDLETGTVAWENADVAFLFEDHGLVYAARQGFEALRFFALDAADGSVRRDFGTDGQAVQSLRQSLNEEDRFVGYSYPVPFTDGHPDFAAHQSIVHGWCPPSRVNGTLDVLRAGPLLIASWHEPDGTDTFTQRFQAYDIDRRRVVYADAINAGVAHPSLDSFFVKDGQVLYVKNQNTLTAHSLSVD
jgi:hypothetical protein